MQSPIVFELDNASAGYDGRPVLSGIDLTVRKGERVAIMGRSGAGKTTLLSLLYQQKRADVALIPQAAALVKSLSVFHNVYMGRLDRYSTFYNLKNLIWPATHDLQAVAQTLQLVEMSDKLRAPAGELSGGQQQRASVARALYNGRPVVLGDEPVSALDRVQAGAVLDVLKARHETLILVLHDVHLALQHTDRIVLLADGVKTLDAPSASLEAAQLLAHFGGEPA